MKALFRLVMFLPVFSSIIGHAQNILVHDPVMIRQDSSYHLFCTGYGISNWSSMDMVTWKAEKPVFASAPKWAMNAIPEFKGHIWAPDISFYQGRYYLFYSVSAFGKNTSCIGLASNGTLNSTDPSFHWVDQGKVIQSVPGRDDWNAIDPNLIVDEQGIPWLAFGSFWSGIKLVKLKDDLTGVAQPEEWYGLARRPRDFKANEREAGDGAIEAPFVFKHGQYYYLFVSFDYCCRGNESTYKIMVGRSEKLTGPYLDDKGRSLWDGGGTLVLKGNANYPGLGHNAVCRFNNTDYIVFHAYDSTDGGRPKLIIRELRWNNNGWPETNL